MTSSESRLVRHLAVAIAMKLAVLAALWWAFVRIDHVIVDADATSAHIANPAYQTATTGASQ